MLPLPSPLTLVPQTQTDDTASTDACTHCKSTLELHQPDPSRPGRLLAVCTDCGAWYLLVIQEIAIPEAVA